MARSKGRSKAAGKKKVARSPRKGGRRKRSKARTAGGFDFDFSPIGAQIDAHMALLGQSKPTGEVTAAIAALKDIRARFQSGKICPQQQIVAIIPQ